MQLAYANRTRKAVCQHKTPENLPSRSEAEREPASGLQNQKVYTLSVFKSFQGFKVHLDKTQAF